MAGTNEKKKIIKKIYKKNNAQHHGGAWKIAYADFVTAMMAFFMIMWLVNSVSLEQKKGIADYFAPNFTLVNKKPGGQGVMAGKNASGVGLTDMTGSVSDEADNNENQKAANANSDKLNNEDNTGGKKNDKEGGGQKESKLESTMSKDLLEVKEKIKRALESNVSLKALSNQIEFSITTEGLNINITDRGNHSMFPPGSVEMYDYMRTIIGEVSNVIKSTPNKISITGHTDAIPYASTKNYSNWELSADRANAVRRMLEQNGVLVERIEYVRGRESKELLNKNDPSSSENRRITITLLK